MLQALCHLWGDFVIQNAWMANTKVKHTAEGWLACLVHTVLYHLPFWLFLHPSAPALTVMFVTHFFIDKFRLAKYLCMVKNWHFAGNGNPGAEYLSVWLLFITDNCLHVTINFLSLNFL